MPGKFRKAIFAEAAGDVGGFSANFDMRLRAGRNDGPGFRAGLGYADASYKNYETGYRVAVPLSYKYIFRNERSGLETGIGLRPSFIVNSPSQGLNPKIAAIGNLGYRLQPLREGLIVRAMWTPGYVRGQFKSTAGLSLGYSFR